MIRINVLTLTEKLRDNVEDITKILIKLGVDEESIKYHSQKGLITSTRPDPSADNKAGLLLYTNSLQYVITTRGAKQGNIFSLVMDIKDKTFPAALSWIANICGYSEDHYKIKLPFGGFYKGLNIQNYDFDPHLDTYNDSDLPDSHSLSQRFFLDNIDFLTQERFGVRYSHEDDAVLIPIRDCRGKLVGCKARNNNPYSVNRYFAKLPYSKNCVVYGYSENYKSIVEKKTVVIFESEKAVMQCSSFGFNVAVAIGGHCISKIQERYIKSLMCKNVIVAFDEGLQEDEIKYEAKKLLNDNKMIHNNVFYIFDDTGEILKKGSKDSPSDHGAEIFQRMMKERIKKIGA